MENTGSDGKKTFEHQDVEGVVASALSSSSGSPTDLTNKPHVKVNYGAVNCYCACPKEGVPYVIIANYAMSALQVHNTSSLLNLLSATEVSNIKWAGGLDKNINNAITASGLFALTLIRVGTTIYASVIEMDSASI